MNHGVQIAANPGKAGPRKRLTTGNVTVKEIAGDLGYSHANDFSRAYKRHFGKLFSLNRK